jgi:hypothetical protein
MDKSLAVLDESRVGNFVASGLLRVPAQSIGAATLSVAAIKASWRIAATTRIHCRTMFQQDARHKSNFSHLTIDEVHALLSHLVGELTRLGVSWWGAHVNVNRYPRTLQLVEGQAFEVTPKHLAGLVAFAALVNMEHFTDTAYRLVFDQDKTKIDWGLARRMQATHFQRTHSNAVALESGWQPLLEMADVAAHTCGQATFARSDPGHRKGRRYTKLANLMQLRTAELRWAPPSQTSEERPIV